MTGIGSKIVVVLPGDDVTSFIPQDNKNKIRLGMGLIRRTKSSSTSLSSLKNKDSNNNNKKKSIIVATLAGRLYRHQNCWFVWTNSKRYQPAVDDRVVGIVQDRMGGGAGGADVYRVDVGGPHTCCLSSLQFEGATKRNRPQFQPGTLIYARVVSCCDDIMDPILSCTLGPKDNGIPRRDWMTEEAAYGELKGGTVQKIHLGLARQLLSPSNVVLDELSKLPFEVAIGVNGYLWIHSLRPEYTILVRNAILNSQVLTEEQTRAMVRSLLATVKQQVEHEDDDEEEERKDDQHYHNDDQDEDEEMEEGEEP